jgi:hypothetical protein
MVECGMPKKPVTIRLSDEGRRLRTRLSKTMGIDETAVIEIAIRELAAAKGIKPLK